MSMSRFHLLSLVLMQTGLTKMDINTTPLIRTLEHMTTTKESLVRVVSELNPVMDRALKLHPEKHPSLEHSLSVVLEEVHELKMEIFKKNPNFQRVKEEALDVALTAIRMVADNEPEMCCTGT